MQFYLILALLFALLVAVFAIQNTAPVTLIFFAWRFQVSLVVIVLGGLAFGAIIMGLLGFLHHIRLSLEIKKLRSSVNQLEKAKATLEEEKEDLLEQLSPAGGTEAAEAEGTEKAMAGEEEAPGAGQKKTSG